MFEESGLPHSRRTVEVGVQGRTGDLVGQLPCGHGNERSSTSIEIDKRSRTSTETDDRLSSSD